MGNIYLKEGSGHVYSTEPGEDVSGKFPAKGGRFPSTLFGVFFKVVEDRLPTLPLQLNGVFIFRIKSYGYFRQARVFFEYNGGQPAAEFIRETFSVLDGRVYGIEVEAKTSMTITRMSAM
jgi:hypothetical protein